MFRPTIQHNNMFNVWRLETERDHWVCMIVMARFTECLVNEVGSRKNHKEQIKRPVSQKVDNNVDWQN